MNIKKNEKRDEKIIALYRDGNLNKDIAKKMKVTPQVVHHVIHKARRDGILGKYGTDPIIPGFGIASTSVTTGADGSVKSRSIRQKPISDEEYVELPGAQLKAGTFQIGPDNRVERKWLKPIFDTKFDIHKFRASLGEILSDIVPAPVTSASGEYQDYCTVYPFADPHIGLYAWARESKINWDLGIAHRSLLTTQRQVIRNTPRSRLAILLYGGDTLHNDDSRNATPGSGNRLDVDGRYNKVVATACALSGSYIEDLLEHHEKVVVRILPGNHDPHSHVAVLMYIIGRYGSHPRVEIDDDPSKFWFYEFGINMLAGTHGDMCKKNDMNQIMAVDRPEMWGRTKCRYAFTFHIHHESKKDLRGAKVMSFRSPAAPDAWHWGAGYRSEQSMYSLTYHATRGQIIEITEPVDISCDQQPEP